MPVDTTHPLYDEFLPKWRRARDVIAGEDAIKAAGELYLPRLESQSDAEYAAYVNRALFFGATGRTADGFSGMVFRRDPVVKLPRTGHSTTEAQRARRSEPDRLSRGDKTDSEGETSNQTAASTRVENIFERMRADVDLFGTGLLSYVKQVSNEIMATGRAGTLVDWSEEEDRPFVCLYAAEEIINWRMERVGGRMMLTLLVLREVRSAPAADDPLETVEVPQIRVLRLATNAKSEMRSARSEGRNGSSGNGRPSGPSLPSLVVEVWQELEVKDGVDGKKEWVKVEERMPSRAGKPLPFIPFVFHGPTNDLPTPSKPPLDDIIVANLDHYRLDADFKHGLHFTALPTAWVSGFDKDAELKIGSTTAWVSETQGASAGFLEFKGQGLQTFEREKDRVEKLMAILGSRMLESQKRVGESAETLSLRQAGEANVVANIAGSLSKSLTKVLRWSYYWCASRTGFSGPPPSRTGPSNSREDDPEDISLDVVSIELNKDFETATMTAQELVAMVQAWQAGLISHDTALNKLREGEILPPSRTNREELELIDARPAPITGASASLKKVRAAEAGEGGGSLMGK